jgi:protein involved in polysaccharide export with SLBB domain
MPPNTPLEEVLQKAGGLTKRAFVFGTRFERTSVRRQQRESFNDAIQQLEVSLAAAPLTNGLNSDAAERGSQLAAAQAVLAKLRQAEPDGRVVLGIEPEASTLPGDLILENNDRIVVPPRPTTVGVFGAVYRPASFLLDPTKVTTVAEYLKRSGGPIKSGARGEIFVVRANGAVLAKRDGALKSRALPGDVIFVPVRTQSSSLWAKIREISTVIFQLGLSTAAFITVTK